MSETIPSGFFTEVQTATPKARTVFGKEKPAFDPLNNRYTMSKYTAPTAGQLSPARAEPPKEPTPEMVKNCTLEAENAKNNEERKLIFDIKPPKPGELVDPTTRAAMEIKQELLDRAKNLAFEGCINHITARTTHATGDAATPTSGLPHKPHTPTRVRF